MDGSLPSEGGLRESAGKPPNGGVEQPQGVDDPQASDTQPQPVESASAVADAASPARLDAGLHLQLEAIGCQLETLHQDFELKLKYDEAKDRQLDALHRELQAHRDDLYFKILRPVLMDLIAMYDDMDSIARHDEGRDPAELSDAALRMRRNLESFTGTIEEILERYGVSAFCHDGDKVSPQRQRSIKQVETSDVEQDRCIAQRLRKGFCYGERVLRPEIVTTYRAVRKHVLDLSEGEEEK